MGYHTPLSYSSTFFEPNKLTPFWLNSAAPIIKPKPTRTSSSLNFLHFHVSAAMAAFNLLTFSFQYKSATLKKISTST